MVMQLYLKLACTSSYLSVGGRGILYLVNFFNILSNVEEKMECCITVVLLIILPELNSEFQFIHSLFILLVL